jgi:hypothetical protein
MQSLSYIEIEFHSSKKRTVYMLMFLGAYTVQMYMMLLQFQKLEWDKLTLKMEVVGNFAM